MPRKYSRKSSRATSYSQDVLETAVQKIKNKELSYNAASRLYGIPISTLNDRVLQKTAIVSNTLGRSTAIPIELEKQLAEGLRTMERWGWGLSRDEVLDITAKFVERNELETPFKNGRPGPDWFIAFRKRHNLSIKKPQSVEYLRKKMTDPFVVDKYFTLLEKAILELNLTDPRRIWNLDETSVCLDPTKTKVVGGKGEPCTRTTSGNAKENVTVLTTVNAAGEKLDPLIIFKGQNMYKQWMLDNPDEYDFQLTYAASKRGWMESDIFYKYMRDVFIPNLGEERPVLLIYDGHVSHVDNRVVALAVENNVTIIKLPAHTSHLLQPLDLAVFKSFKAIWDKNLVKWQRQNVGIKLRKQGFAKMFAEAWKETKPESIQNGFKKGGIYPFNANCIPKEKFDPKAYARWQKHKIIQEPKTLKQLCLEQINKNISFDSPASEQNLTTTHSETASSTLNFKDKPSQPVTLTFEELLLEKVTQHPPNTTAVKLKRLAKGAEVITKAFIEKQQETESNKARETRAQKTKKTKQKSVSQSQDYSADLAKPGPSGIQKAKLKIEKARNVATTLTDMTNDNEKPTKKGKDIGKKSRTDKENQTIKDNENCVERTTSNTKKGKGIGKKTRTGKENQTAKEEKESRVGNSSSQEDLRVLNEPNVINKSINTKKNALKKEKTFSRNTRVQMATKKRKRSSSTATTIESVQMSVHSDSDLLDSISDILSDCCEWNTTDSTNYEKSKTESDVLTKEEQRTQETERIIKDIHDIEKQINNNQEVGTASQVKTEKYDGQKTNIDGKVTLLSSVKMTPENEAFYKVHNRLQLIPVSKDFDIFKNRIQNTDEDYIPSKKIKKVERLTQAKKTSNIHVEIDKNDDELDEDDSTDFKKYDIGQTVLVRYFKKDWKYYVGVIENIVLNPRQYTITYYKSIGKNTNVKFVKPKRKDQDCVPECNIVKQIQLLEINKSPMEYILLNIEDGIFF